METEKNPSHIVKVVILNWNGAHHLRHFLPSVMATTPAEVEIVVADNGSTDDSLTLLRSDFPAIRVLEFEQNYGYAEGYNRTLTMLEADYFVLLNSDVETTPGWIEPLLETLQENASIAAVSPKILSFSDKTSFEYAGAAGGYIDRLGYPFCRGRMLSTIEKDQGQYDDARRVFWTSGACMMVSAGAFREVGGFDGEFFAHMEEIDFCWRAQLFNYTVMYVPSSRVYHLGGGTLPNNTPRKLYLNYRNNLAMLYKNLPSERLGVVLWSRMMLDACSAWIFLLQGNKAFFRAVFRAHRDFRARRKELKSIRHDIQRRSITRSKEIYGGFILLRYFLGRKKFGGLSWKV